MTWLQRSPKRKFLIPSDGLARASIRPCNYNPTVKTHERSALTWFDGSRDWVTDMVPWGWTPLPIHGLQCLLRLYVMSSSALSAERDRLSVLPLQALSSTGILYSRGFALIRWCAGAKLGFKEGRMSSCREEKFSWVGKSGRLVDTEKKCKRNPKMNSSPYLASSYLFLVRSWRGPKSQLHTCLKSEWP